MQEVMGSNPGRDMPVSGALVEDDRTLVKFLHASTFFLLRKFFYRESWVVFGQRQNLVAGTL